MSKSGNWNKFNDTVDLKGLQEDIAAGESNSSKYREVPAGRYEAELERLEIRPTKDGRPMVTAWFRIIHGEYARSVLFENKVIAGTRDDGYMIRSVVDFLNSLDSKVPIAFHDYNQFEDNVMDVFEAVSGKLEYSVDYNPKAFFGVSIEEVFET